MVRPFYLPVTRSTAAALIDQQIIPSLPIEQAAMLVALLHLKRPMSHGELGLMLTQAQELFSGQLVAGTAKLLEMRQSAGLENVRDLATRLAETGILLAPAKHMGVRAWAGLDGKYTTDFQDTCRSMLTPYDVAFDRPGIALSGEVGDDGEPATVKRVQVRLRGTRDQEVVARVVATASDEHISIEAYAGTGKTHLVHALSSHLRGGVTYVAPTLAHRYGFETHANAVKDSGIRVMTMWQLARELAQLHVRELGTGVAAKAGKSGYTLQRQVELAGITSIGAVPAPVVLRQVAKAISSWCHSDAPELEVRHFHRAGLQSTADISSYLAAGRRLWTAMFKTPGKVGQVFDMNIDHLAKWLSLGRMTIPTIYGTFLVDEAHDLSPAWRHIFDRYAGGCVMMGDPHQRLRGQMPRSPRAKGVIMSTSIRNGVGVERLIERTLQLAPERPIQAAFAASSGHITRQRPYSDQSNLPNSGLRLYGNEWAMLEGILRLKSKGAKLLLLPASKDFLDRTTRDALALYSGRALWPGERVSGCDSWDSLAEQLERQGLHGIIRMFEDGFEERNLRALFDAAVPDGQQQITVGLIDHAKNLESGTVTLTSCCFDDASRKRAFQPIHAAYLAMTRARSELWLPGDSVDRLADLWSAQRT